MSIFFVMLVFAHLYVLLFFSRLRRGDVARRQTLWHRLLGARRLLPLGGIILGGAPQYN